jgi:hypothetical protein
LDRDAADMSGRLWRSPDRFRRFHSTAKDLAAGGCDLSRRLIIRRLPRRLTGSARRGRRSRRRSRLSMKQHLKHLDEIARKINAWLLAFAIGLAVLDLTVVCLLKATAMGGTSKGATTGAVERKPPMPAAQPVEVLPGIAS